LDSVIGAGGSKAKPKKRAAKKAPPKTKPQNKVTSITKSEDQPKISTAQKTAILNLGKRRGIEPDELNQMVEKPSVLNYQVSAQAMLPALSEICSKLPDPT
jgi:hypothetical protein